MQPSVEELYQRMLEELNREGRGDLSNDQLQNAARIWARLPSPENLRRLEQIVKRLEIPQDGPHRDGAAASPLNDALKAMPTVPKVDADGDGRITLKERTAARKARLLHSQTGSNTSHLWQLLDHPRETQSKPDHRRAARRAPASPRQAPPATD